MGATPMASHSCRPASRPAAASAPVSAPRAAHWSPPATTTSSPTVVSPVPTRFLLDGVPIAPFCCQGAARAHTLRRGGRPVQRHHLSARGAVLDVPAAGILNIVTKTGTNSLHGDLYEYFRNDQLDAANYFTKRTGVRPLAQSQRLPAAAPLQPVWRLRERSCVSAEALQRQRQNILDLRLRRNTQYSRQLQHHHRTHTPDATGYFY